MFTFKCFLPYVCQQLGSLGGDLHVLRMTALIQFYKIIPDPTNGKGGLALCRDKECYILLVYIGVLKMKVCYPLKTQYFIIFVSLLLSPAAFL